MKGVEGIHFHTLCEQNADALELTLRSVEEKFSPWLSGVKWINFGGGHHITRADYDRELLEEAARTYCIPVSVMERNDETAPSRVLGSFALSAPSLSMLTGAVDYSTIVTSDTTFAWQSATIRRLAKEGPCVIIGRCADHVLRGTPGVVSLFLYADYEARVDHITQKYQLSRGDATILIDETEKERARYYKRHTGQEFARMENYDLCLNTASVNREMAILLLKAFVENQEN